LIAAILVSTWWVPDLRATIVTGGPWMLLLAIGYRVSAARRPGGQKRYQTTLP
jgi:hypothetical protein